MVALDVDDDVVVDDGGDDDDAAGDDDDDDPQLVGARIAFEGISLVPNRQISSV